MRAEEPEGDKEEDKMAAMGVVMEATEEKVVIELELQSKPS